MKIMYYKFFRRNLINIWRSLVMGNKWIKRFVGLELLLIFFVSVFMIRSTEYNKETHMYTVSKVVILLFGIVLIALIINVPFLFKFIKSNTSGGRDSSSKDKFENLTDWLYYKLDSPVRFIKVILQMIVGAGIFTILILKIISIMFKAQLVLFFPNDIILLIQYNSLKMVSRALAISTGFDLAYMLFTDGPDEAFKPLPTAIAAFILYQLSNIDSVNFSNSVGILLAVLTIPILFTIEKKFLKSKKERLLEGLNGLKANKLIDDDQYEIVKNNISSDQSIK